MTDRMKRTETTHIDEVRRTSTSTVQWLLEKENIAGTHPISYNNKIHFLIGGEEGFGDIANRLAKAKESIDICCWGFDPGMELIRGSGNVWPRGETYGDLLIQAGKRGVIVRLLVWYDALAANSKNPRNMPGYTHDVDPSRLSIDPKKRNPDAHRYATEACQMLNERVAAQGSRRKLKEQDFLGVIFMARRNYCMDWYQAAFDGRLENIEIRTRSGDSDAVAKSLESEKNRPSGISDLSPERPGMVYVGTHHQKPILIDFFHDEGSAAVGYIMGLNSLSEYWDTTSHSFDDPRREHELAIGDQSTPGCTYSRPLRDYACRIDGGLSLVAIYNNFSKAWKRAKPNRSHSAINRPSPKEAITLACLRKAEPGAPAVQIVRTQPEESDKTVKDAYFQATDQAALAMGYIYLENQYFQYTEWAERLMATRKKVIERWNVTCASCGKTARDMPILHVFIVIPMPELEGMIPRTYETLAHLGQQKAMKKQDKLIAERSEPQRVGGFGVEMRVPLPQSDVVRDANKIEKPGAKMLEEIYGLKVCTAMLNAYNASNKPSPYREIYIHSKLLLIDDTFLTLGSANLNQRSMAVDSEINLAAVAPNQVAKLRCEIWTQLAGEEANGKGGNRDEIAEAFRLWKSSMAGNRSSKTSGLEIISKILPFEDDRSSTVRMG